VTVQVHQIDPRDESAFEAWYGILQATDEERWGDPLGGWSRREALALATLEGGATTSQCLSALDGSGTTVGIGLCHLPQRDNRHQATLDIRVPADRRRHGIGSRILAETERRLARAGRTVLTALVEVPTALVAPDPSVPFARRSGFVATHSGYRLRLTLPVAADVVARLRHEVARASGGYRIIAFRAPWPEEYLAEQCELARRMSTDAPTGDERHEEEAWDAARIGESDRLLEAQGRVKLVAVAQHGATGRLVAFSELVLPRDHPSEAWQWSTLVLREHRGRRLGLAVKLANLEALSTASAQVEVVITNTAQENLPMIAVNDLLGFRADAASTFWQKGLERAGSG
jgi:GNAT superfamily N-acetyltransferase